MSSNGIYVFLSLYVSYICMGKLDRSRVKLFAILFFTLFCSMMGAGIVAPLLPVYALNLGAAGIMIGFIFSSFSISRSIALPAVGYLSDRFGKKKFITFGLISYVAVSISYCLAKSAWTLVFIRLGHGLAAAMIVPVASAYVGELSPSGHEGKYMGILNVGVFGGLGVGPFLGGVISDAWGMKTAFLTMAALNTIAFVIVLLLVPERKGTGKIIEASSYFKLLKNGRILALMTYRASHFFGVGIIWSFMPLLIIGGHRLSTTYSGGFISLSVLTATILQAPVGKMADHYNRKIIALLGGIFMVVAMAIIPFSSTYTMLCTGIILSGLAGGFIAPAISALTVSEGRFQHAMGSVMGLVLMGQSLGIMLGPIIAGELMDLYGISAAFLSGSVVALVGLVLFIVFGKDFTCETVIEHSLPVRGA